MWPVSLAFFTQCSVFTQCDVFKGHLCCSIYQLPHSFFWLNNTSLDEYTTSCLSIPQLVDSLGCLHFKQCLVGFEFMAEFRKLVGRALGGTLLIIQSSF
jgi:hypothetical protein